jgi:tRNA nucleotidyltransferase/poly(A) polymerase
MKKYLVGGAVRDLLLGIKPKDRDWVVVGSSPEEMLALGYQQVGASFPVFIKDGEEYALARTERKTGVGYNGFDVTFDPSVTLEEDLIRRDLTINAMALDIDTYQLIDPHGGRRDLHNGILRHTSLAFAEDPVRVLRTARFAARYQFSVDPTTIRLMSDVAHELVHVPQERIWAEFKKGLTEDTPHLMMDVLSRCGALSTPALEIYSHANLDMIRNLSPTHPMHVRLGAVFRNTVGDVNAWSKKLNNAKIPAALIKILVTYLREYDILYNYCLQDADTRVRLLDRLRAFSDPNLLSHVMDCMINNDLMYFYVYRPIPSYLTGQKAAAFRDLDTIQANVDSVAIAASVDTKSIKQAIHDARVAALSK